MRLIFQCISGYIILDVHLLQNKHLQCHILDLYVGTGQDILYHHHDRRNGLQCLCRVRLVAIPAPNQNIQHKGHSLHKFHSYIIPIILRPLHHFHLPHSPMCHTILTITLLLHHHLFDTPNHLHLQCLRHHHLSDTPNHLHP